MKRINKPLAILLAIAMMISTTLLTAFGLYDLYPPYDEAEPSTVGCCTAVAKIETLCESALSVVGCCTKVAEVETLCESALSVVLTKSECGPLCETKDCVYDKLYKIECCVCDALYIKEVTCETDSIFNISGPLIIEMSELHRYTDVTALLLRGVTAMDEYGNDITHLITVKYDGGFAAYVAENFADIAPGYGNPGGIISGPAPIMGAMAFDYNYTFSAPVVMSEGYAFETQVIYMIVDSDGEEFVSEPRDVRVRFMGITPMSSQETISAGTLTSEIQGWINLSSAADPLTLYIPAGVVNTLTTALTVGNGRNVTLVGSGYLTVSGTSRHFIVQNGGVFTLAGGITLQGRGGPNDVGGGVYVLGGGIFNMSGGTITGNTIGNQGGGVRVNSGGTVNMSGGSIINNNARTGCGGAIDNAGAFYMTGGTISNNTANSWGGGICNWSAGRFIMSGGYITGNTAGTTGGGMRTWGNTFEMTGGSVSGNTATTRGGGVEHTSGTLRILGGTISDNTAGTDGGGIFTTNYTNLTTSDTAIFFGNSANQAFNHGAANLYGTNVNDRGNIGNIRWASVSLSGTHALNNYDINYIGTIFVVIDTFTVTYDDNDSTGGSVPFDNNEYESGSIVTVLPLGDLEKDGYTFVGWLLYGTDSILQPGDTFIMPSGDVMLIAQWQPVIVDDDDENGESYIKQQQTPTATYARVNPKTGDSIFNTVIMLMAGISFSFSMLAFGIFYTKEKRIKLVDMRRKSE